MTNALNGAGASLRDTKILIPEIPGEWTQRTRSGSTQVWNDPWHKTGLPEVRMEPPTKGLFADRIDGAWYWVCACEKCLGTDKSYNYSPCEAHDRCVTCNCTRADLTEAPWGVQGGWRCKPCQDRLDAARKAEALAAAEAKGHSEDDCVYTSDIICPYCATKQNSDDRHESAHGLECDTCGGKFDLEVEWSPSYTTTKARAQAQQKGPAS
ncbi:hypothetical protein ACUTR7_00240 [Delftia sp. NA_296.1]|uniref:hypothetical protein n=1 Tax=Delftia sp. NA_296.1 TaxID=3415648 RepID=UPI0040463916